MNTKHTIEVMIQLAHSRGGRCVSTKYINNQTPIMWRCAKSHQWETKAAHVLAGSWCPYCSGRHKTIEDLNKHAATHEGRCCSKEYIGAKTNHEWECKYGHRWFATPTNVLRGSWCGKCWGKYITIQDCQKLARQHKGICLEKTYVNSQHPMKWQCADGHIFTKGWSQIKAGFWCQNCTRFVCEELCRSFMEAAFNEKFFRARPTWLLNARGNRMELDGYNESLKLAFEHNGQQHYEEGHFSGDLITRINDDNKKQELCATHGVKLIIFKAIPLKEPLTKIVDYLNSTLGAYHIKSTNTITEQNLSFESIKSPTKLHEFHEIAKRKKGTLLDKQYLGVDHKYEFICAHGHLFSKKGTLLKEGAWCPLCAKNAPHDYDYCVKYAERKGGKLLSPSYKGALTSLLWQCDKGHTWPQRPANIIAMNTWCPKCAKNASPNIAEIQQKAKAKKGKLISEKYINSKTKLTFKCEFGHQWGALYYRIKQGHWCPICTRNRV